ncbi:non-specific lipid transfer protein GPI-anchored 2-like isoform X1 [Lycium ferocissimum]|uniref:non-specific lipid transfer protein GPI-anchored 2-like isoform X1 n=1 Tax=Lycium ferocissimum TaxID=112874 RepID=UPI002816165B|nr:non-specific lipid transfer protein GPI-anchored 2-like isoform X1 [Lycium ferocissimum]
MASTTKLTTTFLLFLLISLFSTRTPSADAQIMPPMATAESPSMAMSPAAAGPSTSGGMDCMTVLLNMSSCLTFVEQGSNLTKPDKECCPALAGLLDSNPICLCQLLGDPDKVGIQIDVNRALKLPTMCSLETPPVSTCAALGIPVAAPTSGEVPASSPGSSTTTSGEGPAASPGGFASSPNAAPTMAFFKMRLVLGLGIMLFTIIF